MKPVLAPLLSVLLTCTSPRTAQEEWLEPGLVAEFYDLGKKTEAFPDLAGLKPAAREIHSQVNFPSTGDQFSDLGLSRHFAVRWTGLLYVPRDGTYTFSTESDDGSRLLIDGKQVVDNGGLHRMVERHGATALKAGHREIAIDLFENGPDAGCIVTWEAEGIPKEVIPAASLFHRPSAARGAAPRKSAARVPKSPLSPREALESMRVAPGFQIQLVAAEPHVMDPTALSVDEDGRIWVCEMADYPLGPPSGRIKVLEDIDGDGRVDKATTFATVPYPKGVMPWRGGVLVPAAPDILFLKDSDGDGKADVREVVYTGFAEGNQQHRANTLQFALDNWIYGANGDSGGTVRRAGSPDAAKVSIRGADFRFRPDFTGFEPVAGNSQYANSFDDWGNRFVNDNSNHIRHPVLPLPYLRRNPHLSVPAVQEMISDHGSAARIFPISVIEKRFNDPHTAGHFTSACSVTVYRGAAFGPEFQGNAFVCEPVHNLVHRDLLEPKGASLVARRAEPNAEFLASTDNWFRPVNLYGGPDGSLYVVDMYRAVIEHPQWIPLEVQRRVDLRAGQDRGRIYRISRTGARPGPPPRLGKASSAELVGHLEHPNAWWRMTAQRLLLERQDKSAVDALRKLARNSTSLGKLHALWTLEGLGELDASLIEPALKDADPRLRVQALRLADARAADLRQAILDRAGDDDPKVRFQVAFTLGALREDAVEALARIAVRDAADPWTRLAVLSSASDAAVRLLARLRSDSPAFLEKLPPGAPEFIRSLADVVGGRRNEAEAAEWLRIAAGGDAAVPARWRILALTSLGPSLKRWGVSLESLLKKSGTDARVGEWSSRALETASDAARDSAERVNAIELLAAMGLNAEVAGRLRGFLRPQEPQDVQLAVVRVLPGGDLSLLEGWASFTPGVRREILKGIMARRDGPPAVVERLERGKIRAIEIEPHHREQLLKNAALRDRARKVLEAPGDSDRAEVVKEVGERVFKLAGDPVRGEKVYVSNCASCHRLHGQGHRVGPDLATVKGRDKRLLLNDILDPNSAIDPTYQVYIVRTKNKEELSGIIAAETPASITLKRPAGEETVVLRRDIADVQAYKASLMPDGVEANVTAQDFADLIEFLHRGGKE